MQQRRIEKMDPVPGGYRVTVTGRDGVLSVPAAVAAELRLKPGIVISDAQLHRLEREAAVAECDDRLARLLASREHSVHEVTVKLRRLGFDQETIDTVVGRYRAKGLLDDGHFALAYVRSLLSRNPAGASYLVGMLRRKGIERQLAEETVAVALADHDEVSLAVQSLRRRWHLIGQFDLERARRKAYTYLSRRGVSYEAAREAFERLYTETHEGISD